LIIVGLQSGLQRLHVPILYGAIRIYADGRRSPASYA